MYDTFEPIKNAIKDEKFQNTIKDNGGEIYFVGGCVRDCFLGKDSKDIDIVVRNIPFEELETILKYHGKVTTTNVGDKFKVIKFISDITSLDYDVALPRIETSLGIGHDEFDVFCDPDIPIEEDLGRRDFTINAIALDSQFKIIDPYNGIIDIINKKIRVISKTSFIDDPLRMVRGIQFASRFDGFKFDEYTFNEIVKHKKLITSVTKERIKEELDKVYHKGSAYVAFQLLSQTDLSYLLFNYHKYSIRDRFAVGANTYEDFYFRIFYDKDSSEDIGDVYMKTLCGDKRTADILRSMKALIDKSTDHLPQVMFLIFEHTKYFTELCRSRVFNDYKHIKSAFAAFVLDPCYPRSLKELKINGNDLIDKVDGDGKKIGYILKHLVSKIFNNKIRNDREYLIREADRIIKDEL